MKVINFFAGAGAGKSTMAAKVFAWLKERKVNAELVTEYAKDVVWGENFKLLEDQLYLLAKQNRKLERIRNKVEVVVTDSPVALNLFYVKDNYLPTTFKPLVLDLVTTYDNINFFIDRGDRFYNTKGRYQTEEVAREDDIKIKNILLENNIDFTEVSSFDDVTDILFLKYKL